ncbi:MAG: M42 family metallopeptidase [Caldisericia bacterium]|nr:M42 family metallopeptidase [Caldisericia bacterium]
MKDILKQFVEISAPSGREEPIQKAIRASIQPYVDEIRTDSLGNLIAHKKGNGKKLLFDAHMDEIGFVATYIDDHGFVHVEPLGGHNPVNLPFQRICFEYGSKGTIGFESEILSKNGADRKEVSFDTLYVDIGARSKNEALSKIRIGETATYDSPFVDLGNRYMSKAMDDRIACALLVKLIQTLQTHHHDLYFVFATQEEVGLVGSKAASYGIEPDFGIALDVTATGFEDTPKGLKRVPMKLGAGPAIKIQDRSMIANHNLNQWIQTVADQNRIPYQFEVLPFGGTNGGVIQTTKSGVYTTCISIPTRYLHSPSEMVDVMDVQNTLQLVKAIAEKEIVL